MYFQKVDAYRLTPKKAMEILINFDAKRFDERSLYYLYMLLSNNIHNFNIHELHILCDKL